MKQTLTRKEGTFHLPRCTLSPGSAPLFFSAFLSEIYPNPASLFSRDCFETGFSPLNKDWVALFID